MSTIAAARRSPARRRLARALALAAAVLGIALPVTWAEAQTAPSTPACPYWIDGHTGQPLVGFPLGTPTNSSLPADGRLGFGGHTYQKQDGSRWRDLATGNVILGFPLGTPPQTLLYPNGNLSFAGRTYILVPCPLIETTTPSAPVPVPPPPVATSPGPAEAPSPVPAAPVKTQPLAAPAAPAPAAARPATPRPAAASANPPSPATASPITSSISPPPAATPANPPSALATNPPPAPALAAAPIPIRFDDQLAALTPLGIRALAHALADLHAGHPVRLVIDGCPTGGPFPDGSPCARRLASLKHLLARRGVANPASLLAPQ